MIRRPYAAGSFYPGTAVSLTNMITGLVDAAAVPEAALGALVPHAGYVYSGGVAAAVLSRIVIPETVIVIGPSHSGMGKPFSVMAEGTWRTPLGDVPVDTALARAIIDASDYAEADELAHVQEHAVEVQVPLLQYFRPDVAIVPMILAGGPAKAYTELGTAIARAIRETGGNALVLASGDMTHYEPDTVAREKDFKAAEAIVGLDADLLTQRYRDLNISMCAYGPAMCLMAAVKELGTAAGELVKYQTSGDATGDRDAVVGYAGIVFRAAAAAEPLVALARATVETFVREGRVPEPPAALTPEMEEAAGVFVSIHRRNGDLRGCIGTFEPHHGNVAQEIIANAIAAATQDPRFNAVKPGELADLEYSVDVLTQPEPVEDASTLDARRYGVIVESGWRRGLLLPDLEGVDTPEEQISISRRKAGIAPGEPVNLYRFEVVRHKE